jgi:hypothetical protein
MTDHADYVAYRLSGGTPRLTKYENSAFRLEIADGLATFHLKREFPSLEAAERVVDEFLRSFEADSLLQGNERVEFYFERGQMKSGAQKYVGLRINLTVAGPRAEANTRAQAPWKRPSEGDTPDAAALIARYENYKQRRETLTTVAYVCLSALQMKAGGRKNVVTLFNIAADVLDTAGELSSNYGGLESARKLDAQSSHRALSDKEGFWLEAAARAFISRLHQVEAGVSSASTLSMSDLPSL